MARRAPFPSRLFLAAVVLSVLVLASLVMAAPALANHRTRGRLHRDSQRRGAAAQESGVPSDLQCHRGGAETN